jgi:nicotinamide riboside transporter PnuC
MNNPNTKKKLRVVLITAIVGGLLFAGLSFAAATEASHSHDEGAYVIGLLADILDGTTFGKWLLHQPSDLLVNLVVATINGLFGAFAFAVVAAFWLWQRKVYAPENKN